MQRKFCFPNRWIPALSSTQLARLLTFLRPTEAGAALALTIERQFMTLDLEAFRGQATHVSRALMDVEYPLAARALKVMMMGMMRHFVTRRIPWKVHGPDLVIFDQFLDVAIHRRKADSRYREPGSIQYFLG
jgi:hypothetical protein